jgi:hypothetical protein
MAARFPHVGDCLKSIGASHIQSFTKSSAMACTEHELRVRAIHGIIDQLHQVQGLGKDTPKEML